MIVYNKETLKDHDVINDFTMKLDSIYREMGKLYNQNMGMSIITPTNKVVIKDDRPKSCPRKTHKHTKKFAPLFCPNIKDVWFRGLMMELRLLLWQDMEINLIKKLDLAFVYLNVCLVIRDIGS